MIFYIATDQDGKKHVLTVEAEAKKLDKNYTEIDQPNDKASIKKLIQESFDHIHQLEQRIEALATEEIPEEGEEFFEAATLRQPAPAPSAPAAAEVRGPTYVDWTIRVTEQFGLLPLAHQLSLAQDALERARESAAICLTHDKQDKDDGPTTA